MQDGKLSILEKKSLCLLCVILGFLAYTCDLLVISDVLIGLLSRGELFPTLCGPPTTDARHRFSSLTMSNIDWSQAISPGLIS